MFNSLDKNKDGKLSLEELKAGLDDLAAYFQYSDIDYEEVLSSMDTDGDGEIDFTEFISAAYNKKTLLTKENLDAAFKTFDVDGNGKISTAELRKVFASGRAGKAQDEIWQEIFKEVDKNGDGEIDYEEFTMTMRAILKKETNKFNNNMN